MQFYSIGGEIAVDKIYRYTEIGEALADISRQLDLAEPIHMPDYKAKAGHRKVKSYRELLDEEPEARAMLGTAFRQELEFFNYQY